MLIKKGDSGNNVKFLQQGLRLVCINSCSMDGIYGNQTERAVIRFQNKNGITTTGIVDDLTWNVLCEQIIPLQRGLKNAGYNIGTIDGIVGAKTYNGILDFQSSHGLTADGMAGTGTLKLLFPDNNDTTPYVLSRGAKGENVKEAQLRLIALGYSCGVAGADGIFGNGTYDSVWDFQRVNGLPVDGIAGPNTLALLYSSTPKRYEVEIPAPSVISETNNIVKSINDEAFLDNFVSIALNENGIVEKYDNLTKYGDWYGMDGEPWCAMFVSWCAHQAGLLATANNANGIIPKYAAVSTGLHWYKRKSRFGAKGSYLPRYGDILFLKNDASHTAITVGYDERTNKIYTIEGNLSNKVCKVWRYADDSRITGYGVNGSNSPGYILEDAIPDTKGDINTR
ncbi:MAG: peptidoglycan-binding protein [Lacrimispora sp.]|uniref:NlpC/P60 family protein n=1 Tax=Lacrimispora sp. TaxID=2719234 RepID=UPI0039E317D9